MKYSLVIPCYNEEKNISLLIERSRKFLLKDNFQLILVENGSTDNSKEVFKEFENKHKNLKVVYVEKNLGYGNGILSGLENADGDILAWTHADLQTDINDVLTGFKLIDKNDISNFVKGKRMGRNFFDKFFTHSMSYICSLLLREKIFDINAQPKIFHKSFYQKICRNAPLDFSLDLYFLLMAKKLKYNVIEFPVFFNKRLHGEAKGGGSIKTKLKLSIRTFSYITKFLSNKKIHDNNST